jgi:vacuolar iron transporter family protein
MIPELKNVIRDFVFGMEDGLVSNLGLVLGVYIGGGETFIVVLAGLASMFAGAFSMAAGSYLSAKAQREVYEQEITTTKKTLEENPQQCITEMRSILKQEGLDKKAIKSLFAKSSKYHHPKFVCNYIVQKKVGISKEKFDAPIKSALAMFFSFLIGSAFPIFPFIFLEGMSAPITATILTVLSLFSVGLIKASYTKRSLLKSGLEITLVGLAAGAIGYIIGSILRLMV